MAQDNVPPPYADDRLLVLRALVGELRERLAPLTQDQRDYVGMYLLKAVWLGEGKPIAEVLEHWEPERRPKLTIVT